MKETIRGLAAVALVTVAASGLAEVRDVAGFDRVMFALPGELVLERGDDYEVVVEAADEDLERIETRVRGSELTIRWNERAFGLFGNRPKGPIAVRVRLPELRGLEVAGSGDVDGGAWVSETFSVEVNGSGSARFAELASEELTLEVAGSGNVQVLKVDAALARIEMRGSGDAELAGSADRQEIEVMGSGDVDAVELEGAQVNVQIMGSGDVRVWANDVLSAEIMGSGDVRYRGSPRVDSASHGSGRVRAL
jgi:hypothetical protein